MKDPWEKDPFEGVMTDKNLDSLERAVQSGDIVAARKALRDMFWTLREAPRPKLPARLIEAPLQREDMPMLSLLAAYHVNPMDKQLKTWALLEPEIYHHRLRLMAKAGMRFPQKAKAYHLTQRQTAANQNLRAGYMPPDSLKKLPKEWLDVLTATQKHKHPEAMIAGGALRDTFNNRTVKDVDIFVKKPDSFFWSPQRRLKKIFKEAGLKVETQYKLCSDGYLHERGDFVLNGQTQMQTYHDDLGVIELETEAWNVIAGDNKTAYNVVFVSGRDADFIFKGGMESYIKVLDIGLCQIACDGKHIYATPEYYKDAENKTLTLCRTRTTEDHIKRVIDKFPGYKPCDAIKTFLEEQKAKKIARERPAPRGYFG